MAETKTPAKFYCSVEYGITGSLSRLTLIYRFFSTQHLPRRDLQTGGGKMNAAEMERESSRPGMMESVLMAFAIYVIMIFSDATRFPEAWCFTIFRTYFIFTTVLLVIFGIGCLIFTYVVGEDRGVPTPCKPLKELRDRRRREAHRRRRSSGTSAVLEAMGEPSPMRGDDSIAALEALGGGDQRAALSFSSPREEEVRTGSTTAE